MNSAALRRQAEFCLELARLLSDNKSKLELQKLAANYRFLAQKAEQTEPVTNIMIGRESE